jgi:hypothetical protein
VSADYLLGLSNDTNALLHEAGEEEHDEDALEVSTDSLLNRTDDPTPPQKRPRSRKTAPVG